MVGLDLLRQLPNVTESDAELVKVQAGINGRSTVTFSFRGESLSHLADMYHNEQALANVAQMREKLNLLRDILFKSRES